MPFDCCVIFWGPFVVNSELTQQWLYQTNIMASFARSERDCESRYYQQARIVAKTRAAKRVQLERTS